jgi:arylsulfatase A-like enzyme
MFLLPCAGCGPRGGGADSRPNVLLIVIDTLRWDHVGSYGAERDTTPALDRLAGDGVRFERAYAPSGWTNPSIATLFTGLHPSSHTVTSLDRRLPDAVETLAEILAANGYATSGVVSSRHIGPKHGFDQGFDTFSTREARGHEHASTQGVTLQAMEQLERLSATSPFLLFVHYLDPHYTYLRHPEIGFAAEAKGRLVGGEPIYALREWMDDMTDEELEFLKSVYDEEVRFTDDGIGQLLERLRQLGLEEETLIVVTADHGEEFLGHGWLGHTRTLYEELVRVPLIVRAPEGSLRGAVVREPVSLVALAATVLDVVGIDPADFPFQGRSLRSLLEGGEPRPTGEPVFFEVDFVPIREGRLVGESHKKAVIEDGRYKLIRDDATGALELYDLERDPDERNDLSSDEPETLARLRDLLERSIADAAAARVEPELRSFDQREVERLKALGYVGDTP